MLRLRVAVALIAAVATGACGEATAPVVHDNLVRDESQWSTWSTRCMYPAPPPGVLAHKNTAPALETYCTSFWVTQGQPKTFEIRYAAPPPTSSDGGDGSTDLGDVFLRLRIPEDAVLVDSVGRPVPAGTRVLMTVSVHPSLFVVQFGPHGSRFDQRHPAVLSLKYSWAALGGRNPAGLQVWYQPEAGTEWSAEPTTVDVNGQTVRVLLQHFSNYAVAW